jgi:uncharacterized protein (TIGR04255 family)
VAISVQFDALPNYSQVWAGPLWDLFKTRFPVVQEQLPLQPVFETFGSPLSPPSINFSLLDAPMPSRLWFLNQDQTELLQFQSDRFGRNWRKLPPLDNLYPRFEKMIADFDRDFDSLSAFCKERGIGNLQPNQCELTYVNFVPASSLQEMQAHIPASSLQQTQAHAAGVLKIFQFDPNYLPASFSSNFSFVLRGEREEPYGRLHLQAMTAVRFDGVEGLNLTLIARGAPRERSVRSSVERLVEFRERIVRSFDAVTRESAHRVWGRK